MDKSSFREAWRKVRKIIRNADVVLEVLEARNPMGTRSLKLEKLVSRLGKPLILVINKADLVPREIMDEWKNVFEKEYPTIYISARKRLGTTFLWKTIRKVVPGNKPVVKVAVVGYPNVGKSSIINILKGRHSASTSPKAGYTKHVQEYRASRWLKVIDTPGVIPLRESEVTLVLRFALNPEDLSDPVGTACKLIKLGLKLHPEVFKETYKVQSKTPEEILREIALKRGLLLKGGKLNIEEAARIVLRDWINGKLVFYIPPPRSKQSFSNTL
ncbi:MAG: 50S ribosome-binding GTPase [Thermoproteales archaeon]|nr:50S ribosome-binding GTPase [Thermoproteales archaeon]RLE67274.1 MAG: GTP-binding protein [Thermoprotei archaeon]